MTLRELQMQLEKLTEQHGPETPVHVSFQTLLRNNDLTDPTHYRANFIHGDQDAIHIIVVQNHDELNNRHKLFHLER